MMSESAKRNKKSLDLQDKDMQMELETKILEHQ